MRFLHICAGWQENNGAAVIARLLMAEQRAEGHEVSFATWATRKQLRQADVVVNHCAWMPCLWWAALWAKHLWWVPEASYDPVRRAYHGWKKICVGPIERFCLRRAEKIIATCPAEVAWIQSYISPCPLIEVTDICRFFHWTNEKTPSHKPLRLLYLGRPHPLKDVASLEAAVVHFEGQVTLRQVSNAFGAEKEKVWDWCDVLVLPTLSDNFGLVIAEALVHGKRVITTDGAPAWENHSEVIYLKGYRTAPAAMRIAQLQSAIQSLLIEA